MVCVPGLELAVFVHVITGLSHPPLGWVMCPSYRNVRSGSKGLSELAKLHHHESAYSFSFSPHAA